MVESEINDGAESYSLTAGGSQYVTFLVVPNYQLDAFSVTVTDANGVIAVYFPAIFFSYI